MYNGAAVFSGRRFSRALGGSPRGGANDQGHFAASRRRGAAARLTKEEAQLAENVTVLAFFAMIAAVVALGSPWWVTRPELNSSAAHALAPDACRFQLHIGLWHYCSEMTGEQCATTGVAGWRESNCTSTFVKLDCEAYDQAHGGGDLRTLDPFHAGALGSGGAGGASPRLRSMEQLCHGKFALNRTMQCVAAAVATLGFCTLMLLGITRAQMLAPLAVLFNGLATLAGLASTLLFMQLKDALQAEARDKSRPYTFDYAFFLSLASWLLSAAAAYKGISLVKDDDEGDEGGEDASDDDGEGSERQRKGSHTWAELSTSAPSPRLDSSSSSSSSYQGGADGGAGYQSGGGYQTAAADFSLDDASGGSGGSAGQDVNGLVRMASLGGVKLPGSGPGFGI